MLYGRGPVWLNGSPLPNSSAVFPGDLIKTQPESLATLDASGSGVIVLPDSVVKFEGKAVTLEHGSVNVATSVGMVAIAGVVTVTPASNTWTEFEVGDTNGTVQVFASKGSVSVNCGKDTANLTEGEQANPDDSGKCNKKKRKAAGRAFSRRRRLVDESICYRWSCGYNRRDRLPAAVQFFPAIYESIQTVATSYFTSSSLVLNCGRRS